MTTERTRSRKIPSLCLHRATGQAIVRLDGRDFSCGSYGTPEARQKYDRVVAEWLLAGQQARPAPAQGGPPADAGLTVDDLILAYWTGQVSTYYLKNGKPTSEQDNVRQALRFTRRLYSATPAARFGPLALKAVRQSMIDAGRCRTLINKDLGRTRALFSWAVGNEPAARRGLPGPGGGDEAEPVGPAADEHVWAVLGSCPPRCGP